MSEDVLMDVEMATIGWQSVMQTNQEVTATTVDQAANYLMTLYGLAQSALSKIMASQPTDKSSSKYSTEVELWETTYNNASQSWQAEENAWNTPIQSLDTQEQSLGNDSQQASQICSTVIKPNSNVANLLQSQL